MARGEVERLVRDIDAANESVKLAQDELLAAQVKELREPVTHWAFAGARLGVSIISTRIHATSVDSGKHATYARLIIVWFMAQQH